MSAPTQNTTTTSPGARPQGSAEAPPTRQFVSFNAFRLDPAFRRESAEVKAAARRELVEAVEAKRDGLICLSYSTVGLKVDADLLLWRISASAETIQAHTAAINKTALGGWLNVTHSLLSMTKRSQYIDPVDPFHTVESRTRIVPGRRKYLFVYPFVKSRDWYLLPMEKRQELMNNHIRIGNEYPSVKLNTTYSFGLDDQDFVVAFETDSPADFLDLVQHLRETEASKYTVRDTPMFTCVQKPVDQVLDELF